MWISEWIDFVDLSADSQQIMISTYESFVFEPQKYFDDILAFLGRSPGEILIPAITPTTEKNFRLGNPDEWTQVFSEAQRTLAEKTIPSEMKLRFNWRCS
jgi:hypothetical protein